MNEKYGEIGVYIHLFFPRKTVTTKTWPCGALDYSNKNDNHSIGSYFFEVTVLFFLPKYQLQWPKSKFEEENNQSKKEVGLRCMSNLEWHDITRNILIMSQKLIDKSKYRKFISHYFILD